MHDGFLSLHGEFPHPTPLSPEEKLPKSHDCGIETLDASVELTEIWGILANAETWWVRSSSVTPHVCLQLLVCRCVCKMWRCGAAVSLTEGPKVASPSPFAAVATTRISRACRSSHHTGRVQGIVSWTPYMLCHAPFSPVTLSRTRRINTPAK